MALHWTQMALPADWTQHRDIKPNYSYFFVLQAASQSTQMAFPVELTQHDIKPNDSYLLYYKRFPLKSKWPFQ